MLDAVFALDDPVALVGDLKDHVGRTALARGWDRLAPVERRVIDLWWFEAEVMNGGFHQFFWNSTGDRAHETLAGLEEVGDTAGAGLLAQGIALFPDGPSPDRDARIVQMDAWGPAERAVLEALDLAYYRRPSALMERVAAHCRLHRDAFTG